MSDPATTYGLILLSHKRFNLVHLILKTYLLLRVTSNAKSDRPESITRHNVRTLECKPAPQ